jgi:rhombotail lipoprotein
MKIGPALVLGCALCGCSTGYNRGALDAALREAKPSYVSSELTVEQIERLQPQLRLPARIAVAPPVTAYRESWRADPLTTWRPEEVAVIESWREPLRSAGIVEDLFILPGGLIQGCAPQDHGCRLRAERAAAARLHADAIVIVSFATSTDEYVNPASILYITVAGLWLVPGSHRNALTVAEGVLLDNRNEYLYAFARGEGESKLTRPAMYADTPSVVRSSRVEALKRFGEAFVDQVRRLRAKE